MRKPQQGFNRRDRTAHAARSQSIALQLIQKPLHINGAHLLDRAIHKGQKPQGLPLIIATGVAAFAMEPQGQEPLMGRRKGQIRAIDPIGFRP